MQEDQTKYGWVTLMLEDMTIKKTCAIQSPNSNNKMIMITAILNIIVIIIK